MSDRVPVILDTDIGTDIDDTWALAMLLRCPELDLKLVTSATHDTVYRAKLIARLLEVAGRTDVPVGVGIRQRQEPGPQADWVAGYDLARYSGTVREDGVGALVDTILAAPRPVTLICIGPAPNIAAALTREPRIAERTRFVGMYGDLRGGYKGNEAPVAEYNVKADVPAAQQTFTAAWDMTITPLDTCGRVRLVGEKYRAVRDCADPLARAVIENYTVWAKTIGWHDHWGLKPNPETMSSVLFDTVAIYLAFADDLLEMERLGVRVTDDGHTVIDPRAKTIACATRWKDMAAFEDLLVARLLGRGLSST
jgi:inosine-uridine nucleoside N-ribohydrolase